VEDPNLINSVDHEIAEAEAQAALDRRARERIAMSAREFVSERDALEDAWAGSGEHRARDEGW
jgi:E3 ubiquitin-protein ligase DOA10